MIHRYWYCDVLLVCGFTMHMYKSESKDKGRDHMTVTERHSRVMSHYPKLEF